MKTQEKDLLLFEKTIDKILHIDLDHSAIVLVDGRNVGLVGPGNYKAHHFEELRGRLWVRSHDWQAVIIDHRCFRAAFRVGPFSSSDHTQVGVEIVVMLTIERERILRLWHVFGDTTDAITSMNLVEHFNPTVANIFQDWLKDQLAEELRPDKKTRDSVQLMLEMELQPRLRDASVGIKDVVAVNFICPGQERIEAIKDATVLRSREAEATVEYLTREVGIQQQLLQVEREITKIQAAREEIKKVLPQGVASKEGTSYVWRFPAANSVESIGPVRSRVAVRDAVVYLADMRGYVYCLDLSTGMKRRGWKSVVLPDAVKGGLVLTEMPQGQTVLLVPCVDGNLYLIDPVSGEIRDVYRTQGRLESEPLVVDELVYLSCAVQKDWGGVVALSLEDGAKVGEWNAPNKKGVSGTPIVTSRFVYFATLDFSGQTIYRGDVFHSGEAELVYRTHSRVSVAPTLDRVRHCMYVSCEHGYIYAVGYGRASGNWERQVSTSRIRRPSTLAEGRLYVGDEAGSFYALDPERDGAVLWQNLHMTREGKAVSTNPVFFNGLVFFGSKDGSVYSLSADNGKSFGAFSSDFNGRVGMVELVPEERPLLLVGCDDKLEGALYASHWHLGKREEAAQKLEQLRQWEEAGRYWLEVANFTRSIQSYKRGGNYVLAAQISERAMNYGQAAESYECAAEQALRAGEKADFYQRAAQSWDKTGAVQKVMWCRHRRAHLLQAPLLYAELENEIGTVFPGSDVTLDLCIRNQGASEARNVVLCVLGDVRQVCKSEGIRVLPPGEKVYVHIPKVVPVTTGRAGGTARVVVRTLHEDERGRTDESDALTLELRVGH
jgi:outer membrane protein assembly factor BamB